MPSLAMLLVTTEQVLGYWGVLDSPFFGSTTSPWSSHLLEICPLVYQSLSIQILEPHQAMDYQIKVSFLTIGSISLKGKQSKHGKVIPK